MRKVKAWIGAARLRTLPLSISGILVGTSLANLEGHQDIVILLFCLLITILFQITSNFANDYGDGIKGTDDEYRLGPERALQSGALTAKELKWGIAVTALISLVVSITLLIYVFGWGNLTYVFLFLGLAAISIWAAIKYTVGDSAYGYKGLGDVFVFLFFGILAVLGTKFLYIQNLQLVDLLPAIGIGCLCVGVLNLNNLRDVVSDRNHGKNTLIVRMGFEKGKRYHLVLLFTSLFSFVGFALIHFKDWRLFFLAPFVLILIHLVKVLKTSNAVELDPELKKLALSTFFISLMLYLTINYFL